MASALAAVAFACVALLACLLPAYWTSRNIAMMALICWLFICNAIQGVNTIVWEGNVEGRALVLLQAQNCCLAHEWQYLQLAYVYPIE